MANGVLPALLLPWCSVPVVLQPAAGDAVCPSLAYFQPSLAFLQPDGLPGAPPLGLMLGARSSNSTVAGLYQTQQDAVVFANSAMFGQPAQLVARVGSTSAAPGAINLPGAVQLAVQP